MRFGSDPLVTILVVVTVMVAAIAVLLSALIYRLLLDRGRLLLGLQELRTTRAHGSRQGRGHPAGTFLANFALPARDGAMVTFSELNENSVLLTFLRAECLYSRAFARELTVLPPELLAPRLLAIVTGESDEAAMLSVFADAPGLLLFDRHGQVANLMRIAATPSGYLVDERRRTVGPLLMGPVALLAAARGEPVPESDEEPVALAPLTAPSSTAPPPLEVGVAAPDFTLPLLHGGEWSLAAQRGAPVTLIFADPLCLPCADLLAAYGSRADTGVVIVSRGDAEENHQLVAATGVVAPLLLQRQREVARAFRSLETPSAFRIDAQGMIAAGPVVGRADVLALIDQAEWDGVARHTDPARPGIRH